MASNQISLNPSSIARVLGAIAFLLILASTGVQLTSYLTGRNNIFGLVRLFYIDAEQNIPTFFSMFILLFAALLLGFITALKRNQTAPHISHWMVLSFGFLYMSADKAVSIHEALIRPTRMLLGDGHLGVFYFSWVIPGIILTLVLALFFRSFLLHLPPKTRRTFLVAAILYIGGAIGLELIGGRYFELYGDNWTYKMISTVEESLEMAGIIVFIQALLVYIADNHKEVRFRFDTVRGEVTNDDPQA